MNSDLINTTDGFSVFGNGYIIRNGYVFTSWNDRPHTFDVLVIKVPHDAIGNTRYYPNTNHSLDEHIHLICEEKIKRAEIIADDISFITKCSSLKEISIIPSNSARAHFDYSPLYQIPQIRKLSCQTVYGEKEDLLCSIDYSKFYELVDLAVYGKGHLNYNSVKTLNRFWASNLKKCDDLNQLSNSNQLKELTLLQCNVKSLNGIEKYQKLQSLDLSYNRSLRDISKLSKIGNSLRLLNIEGCPKIEDFSCLYDLLCLEHLAINGNNVLPNLEFLKNMPKLKTFTFSTEIKNGDLSPCLNVPYASCSKNKKWYNLNDKDLPKQQPTEPFKII